MNGKNTELQLIISHRRPYLLGYGEFKNRTVFGLIPGDLIVKIGKLTPNGKISSSCRIDTYDYPALYVGVVEFNNCEWIVFKIDERSIQADLKGKNLYAVYVPLEAEGHQELNFPDYGNLTTSIFHAVFEKVGKSSDRIVFAEQQTVLLYGK